MRVSGEGGAARIAMIALVCAVISAVSGVARAADDCPLDADAAMSLSAEQLKSLLDSRAAPEGLGALHLDRLESAIGDYLDLEQSPGDRRPRGLLFYIADRDMVCALYWQRPATRNGGPGPRIFRLDKSPVELAALIERNVGAAVAAPAASARSPRRRHGLGETTSRGAASLARSPAGISPPQALEELSGALFPPEIAAGLERLSSLSIVPALNIGTVPFAALDPDGDGRQMVELTAFNIEQSMLDVGNARAFGWAPGFRRPVVVGDPDASDDPDWVLPRLPGAEREAQEVAGVLGTLAITGADATPARVEIRLPEADYIHIAAHGISSVEDPVDGSFLALSGGRFTARQIQEMQLTGMPLVVLSACQTGLGGPLEAGIVGLARAFVLAGAIEVVVSLWNVDDEATRFMVTRFVTELDHAAPVEALRRAQLATRAKWPEPVHWAPFVAFGSRVVSQ